MTTLLWHLVREVLTEIGQLSENVATDGTTSTVVDGDLGGSDDDWNGGTVIVTRDAAGAGAAPEGEFTEVTDYTSSTGTITVASATFTAAPAAGDLYGVSTSYFPLQQVKRSINHALSSLGDIVLTDTTTLDTAASQTEYTYAVAWKRSPPYRVDMQTKTGDADDNRWVTIWDWEYVPATAGSTGLIVLPQLPTSRDLRIWYRGQHPIVNDYDDAIYMGFHPEVVMWEAVYHLLAWQNGRLSGGDPSIVDQLNNAEEKRQIFAAKFPTWSPKRASRFLITGRYTEKDQFTYPDPP